MRTQFVSFVFAFLSFNLLAQTQKLDVEGDSRINGRLDLLKGTGNTLAGFEAGKIMGTQAHSNTYFGYQAGVSDANGHENAFFGYQAGLNNVGNQMAGFDTPGNRNTFIGHRAGSTNVSGFDNCLVGFKAGEATLEDRNVFVGAYTGIANTTGEKNTYLGTAAGEFSTNSENIMIGFWAGRNNNGSKNCLLGTQAGYSGDGSSNVFIGYQAGFNESGSNLLYIENSNSAAPLIWGDFLNNDVQINGDLCYTGTLSMCSDLRFKKNVRKISDPLSRLLKLKGIIHEWKHEEFPNKVWKRGEEYSIIAQEVEAEFPELVSEGKDGYKYVDYVKFTPILIEVIKEQQSMIQNLKEELSELKKNDAIRDGELAQIKRMLEKIYPTHKS